MPFYRTLAIATQHSCVAIVIC